MLSYFKSKEFLLSVLGLILAGILFYLAIFFVILPLYTRHGKGVLVPDVFELSLEEAEKKLEEAGLRFEVEDSTYREDFPALTVMKQYPRPYSRVKPRRQILLTLNQTQPPLVGVPDIKDKTLYQARTTLENWKLAVGEVTYVPDEADDEKVLGIAYQGQEIEAGAKVPQGARIDLQVANGLRGRRVGIPDLVGYSYDEALAVLRQRGLSVGSILYTPDYEEGQENTIYNQNPRADFGDSIRIGYSIDLYIYGEEPVDEEETGMEMIENGGNN